MRNLSDKELISMLTSPDEQVVNEAIRVLYRQYYLFVCAYLREYKASPQDMRDAFQESIIALYTSIRKGDEITVVGGWLRSTARNSMVRINSKQHWLVSEDMSKPSLLTDTPLDIYHDDQHVSHEQASLLMDLLDSLGKICKGLLIGYYFNKASIKQLMDDYKISSVQVTRNQKHVCLKKLKNTILSNPSLINYFRP